MKTVTFNISDKVRHEVPVDYARNVPNSAIRVLNETFGGGFLVRWDDSELQIVGEEGGSSFQRGRLYGFILKHVRLMRWRFFGLFVKMGERGGLPFVLALDENESLVRDLVDQMLAAGVPLQPLEDLVRAEGDANG